MRPFWESWEYWLILFTWTPWAAFVVVYWRSSRRWWRDSLGRGVMAPAASMDMLLTFSLISRMFDLPEDALGGFRAVMFTAVIVAGWLLLFALLRELRAARHSTCPKRRATDR
jgi:hypothetical protein